MSLNIVSIVRSIEPLQISLHGTPKHLNYSITLQPIAPDNILPPDLPLYNVHIPYNPSYLGIELNHALLKRLDRASYDDMLSNCVLPIKTMAEECSHIQFKTLMNLANQSACKCNNSQTSRSSTCDRNGNCKTSAARSSHDHVSVFAITPTYAKLSQKVDLTSLCYAVENVPNFIWIVVEDSEEKSSLVSSVLTRCKVSVYNMHSNHKLHFTTYGSRLLPMYVCMYVCTYGAV